MLAITWISSTNKQKLARLIGGGRTKEPARNLPQQRLVKFKRTNSQALQIWHKVTAGDTDPDSITIELIHVYLQHLTSLLEDDTRAPAPHPCLSFASSSYVYTAIGRIALSLKNEAITREVISFFTILIDSDEESLLARKHFAETLLDFVDGVLVHAPRTGALDIQNEILELIFGIAAKIRLEPDLLPVWFRNKSPLSADEDPGGEEQLQEIEFPLCHQFIGYVYSEGRAGDFARTGLLYILESASSSPDLEDWIATSDLPTLMASGLGGLYSQLSRKLTIARPKESLPIVLALSDALDAEVSVEAESFFSEELQSQLDTFMSYMVFWQDVLEHCHSTEIKQTLLERFQIEFLQQILYPSLLQSSDRDGGSSVAVLTYLCRILTSVNHSDIIHLILHYLLALPGPATSQSKPSSPIRRRQSMPRLEPEVDRNGLNPSYFNLTDLILGGCQSSNPETVTASLRLVTIILDKHHPYAISSLVRTTPVFDYQNQRLAGTLAADLEILISLAIDIGGREGVNEAYGDSIKDSITYIEVHPCSSRMLEDGSSLSPSKAVSSKKMGLLNNEPDLMQLHCVKLDDPLLKQLDTLLRTFLTNSVETNLGLTSAISYLASCPFARLDGWLTPFDVDASLDNDAAEGEQSGAENGEVEDINLGEERRIDAFKRGRKAASASAPAPPEQAPAFIRSFRSLLASLASVKADIPEFDHYVSSRKRAFQGAIELENNMHEATPSISMSPRTSLDISRDASVSRGIPIPPLSPSQTNNQQSLSTSPRGRTLSSIAGAVRSSVITSPRPFDTSKRPTPLGSPAMRPLQSSRGPSSSPVRTSRALSPLSATFDADDYALPEPAKSPVKSHADSVEEEIFERKIGFPETSGVATLAHVLTNVVILQEFVLELAAIIHVRAGLLKDELRFV